MNSPCRVAKYLALSLLFVLLTVPSDLARGQEALTLSVADEAPLTLAPGSVGSRPILLSNSGQGPVTARLRLDLPTGWSMLIPPPSAVIGAGERISQLLTFTVPSDAASGRYEIILETDASESNRLILPVDVPARPSVAAEWMDQPDLVRAGNRIEATLRVTNTGNATTVWDFDARSSLSLLTQVEPASLELGAGESGSIRVMANTRDDITSRLTHALSVSISVRSANTPLRRMTLSTDIYPTRVTSRQRSEGTLPAALTAVATSEDGTQAAQVSFRIQETEFKGRLVEALVRVPDLRQQSTFAQPDRYSFRVASPDWSLKLGDHNWDATDLLEIGSLGFGMGGDYRTSRLRSGGFVQRSRQVFPEQQQAFVFTKASVRDNLTVGLNALAKRSFEEGESASLDVAWEPGEQFFQAEIAQGWFGDEGGRAAQMNMVLQRKGSMMTLQAEAADDGFLGALRGARGGSMSTRVEFNRGIRWTSQARVRERRYDLGEAGRATQAVGLGRTALTLNRSRDQYRSSLTVTAQGQLNNNSLTDLRREETALESRFTLNRRRMGINALARRGQSKDPSRPSLEPYLASQLSVFATRRSLSINTSVSWLDGPTFYNPVEQQRVSIGVNLGWDSGKGSRLTLGGLHSEDRLRPEQSFGMADLRFEHEFPFGHLLTLRARTVQTAFDTSIRDGSLSMSWSVPLFIPVPGSGARRQEIPGRVVDAETGAPVPDARINLGQRSATTDGDGYFSIRFDGEATGYLSIDRASIGFGRRPVESMPMAVEPALIAPEGILISVVRSAELTVQVDVDTGTGGARQSALNTALSDDDKAGVLIEIRSPHDRLRRITDRSGQARFPDLVPGTWKAFIVGASLPPETVSRPDTVQIDLEPGLPGEGLLTIAPERREVRLVGSGGISLSGGIRPSGAVSISLEREDAETGDEAEREDVEAERPESVEDDGGERSHTVVDGESLAQLARRYYSGSTLHWIRIWRANLGTLPDPDLVRPGQVLTIPPLGSLTTVERQALLDRANAPQ